MSTKNMAEIWKFRVPCSRRLGLSKWWEEHEVEEPEALEGGKERQIIWKGAEEGEGEEEDVGGSEMEGKEEVVEEAVDEEGVRDEAWLEGRSCMACTTTPLRAFSTALRRSPSRALTTPLPSGEVLISKW